MGTIVKLLSITAAAIALFYVAYRLFRSHKRNQNNKILQIRLAAAQRRQQERDIARAQAIANEEARKWGEF
jgi:hypothetical protein